MAEQNLENPKISLPQIIHRIGDLLDRYENEDVDISHKTLQSIEGETYGIVKQILKRMAK